MLKLNNFTIRTRLIAVIGFLSLQLIVGGVIGIASLSHTNSSVRTLYDDRLVALGQLDGIIRLINQNESDVAKAITGEQSNLDERLKLIDARRAQADKTWDAYMATYLTPEEKRLADEFVAARKRYLAEGVKPALESLKVLDTQGAVTALHGPMTALFLPMTEKMNALIQLQLDVAKLEYNESQSLYTWVRNSCIAGVIFGIVLAGLVGGWLVRAITKPLDAAVELAESVASGDLTRHVEATSNDETGRLMRALQNMNDSLARIVRQVRTGTDTIATGSTEIAAGNQDLSARTEQQASSLEETAASLEELTSTVKQNADNSRQADQLARSASEVAGKGGEVVTQVVQTMGSISDSSRKIADIISVIDGIAFQTNILALNAAVEAARAGEQGRGFAVVATEVRTLAQRSAAAAKEIKELINDSVEKVNAGTRLVDEAGTTMRDIVASIQRVSDIVSEITAASHEQTSGIDQINTAVSQMDQVTQQNAALVEEAAAAAEAMRKNAVDLADAVSVFRVAT
ncbi:HAMP domain-containing protein [Oxalobacteraceae bacterium OM1]|nr:HAMP domain-containing protein [Oxalobacteraceae bacterium OM1]